MFSLLKTLANPRLPATARSFASQGANAASSEKVTEIKELVGSQEGLKTLKAVVTGTIMVLQKKLEALGPVDDNPTDRQALRQNVRAIRQEERLRELHDLANKIDTKLDANHESSAPKP
jgi:hypothetical protein